MSRCGERGTSMIEIIVVLALVAVVLQASAPGFVRWRQRQQLEAALHGVRFALSRACALAVASGRHHGLILAVEADGLRWQTVVDGDGDGIRSDDLRRSADTVIESPWVLARQHPGVTVGRPSGVPPVDGGAPGSGGVAFGRSQIISCTASGAARSGTLYLRSGSGDGGALRVYGPSARMALWWWDSERLEWAPIG